jgi:hypothetical protein
MLSRGTDIALFITTLIIMLEKVMSMLTLLTIDIKINGEEVFLKILKNKNEIFLFFFSIFEFLIFVSSTLTLLCVCASPCNKEKSEVELYKE